MTARRPATCWPERRVSVSREEERSDVEELLEVLAEQSHIGWMEEKQRQGFADHPFDYVKCWNLPKGPSPCSIPLDQHHSDMLPYADLAENVKAYDRQTVRKVLDGIAAAGYQIVPAD